MFDCIDRDVSAISAKHLFDGRLILAMAGPPIIGKSTFAGRIAANALLTVKAMNLISKKMLKDPADIDLPLCDSLVSACFAREDYKKGRRAFLEKREPDFKGR